jgi:hypothetical protein
MYIIVETDVTLLVFRNVNAVVTYDELAGSREAF